MALIDGTASAPGNAQGNASGGHRIAYTQFTPDTPDHRPGVVFIHGWRSDRNGSKAVYLRDRCVEHGQAYLSFDLFSHGATTGAVAEFTITRAVEDAAFMIENFTSGPQIVVGSSMGGWVALKLMQLRPDRIAGLVGIAAAPDFTANVEETLTQGQKTALAGAGYFEIPGHPENYMITKTLLEDGRANNFVLGAPFDFAGPVHLLQGGEDSQVPWQTAERIRQNFANPDKVTVDLVLDGDHSLSRPQDLALLGQAIDRISASTGH